jgi:dsDNA-binding SOS-regulon protein
MSNGSERCYTMEELSEILESLNINKEEFSSREIGAFLRQNKEDINKHFADYEADRLRLLSKMLTEFMGRGGENA